MSHAAISVTYRPWVDRFYRVLAHLDPGRDAANIFDPDLPKVAWADALQATYRPAWQFLPLIAVSEVELVRRMPTPLLAAYGEVSIDAGAVPAFDVTQLSGLRSALWGERPPPELTVLHVPSLGRHGRAVPHPNGARTVATSLSDPLALIQVFHEECHPVTDPAVRAAATGAEKRDTRAGSEGYGVHMALERAAVERGRVVITRARPELGPAYSEWCRRYGM